MKTTALKKTVVLFMFVPFLFSCSQLSSLDLGEMELSLKQSSNARTADSHEVSRLDTGELTFGSWQDQLEYAKKEGGRHHISHRNGLYLVGYRERLVGFSEIADIRLSRETVGVVQLDARNIDGNFVIDRLLNDHLVEKYNHRKQAILKDFTDNRCGTSLKVVELEWLYKGNRITTQCIVSEMYKTFVYDDIASNITFYTVTDSSEEEKTPLASMSMHTSSSEESGNKSISYKFSKSVSQSHWLWRWRTVAEAKVSVSVYGQKNSNQKSITQHSSSNSKWADSGYSAEAVVSTASFTAGTSGHYSFGWAVGVGSGSTLTITGTGISVSITGGEFGFNGHEYVLPSNLN